MLLAVATLPMTNTMSNRTSTPLGTSAVCPCRRGVPYQNSGFEAAEVFAVLKYGDLGYSISMLYRNAWSTACGLFHIKVVWERLEQLHLGLPYQ